jgi:hypothetical protein
VESNRSKHIDVLQQHFARQLVARRALWFLCVSERMLEDYPTTLLLQVAFEAGRTGKDLN